MNLHIEQEKVSGTFFLFPRPAAGAEGAFQAQLPDDATLPLRAAQRAAAVHAAAHRGIFAYGLSR